MISCGIYLIKCEGKTYVGASVNIERRWRVHKSELKNGKHCNQKLQRAWNKYGEASFAFEIVELCDRGLIVEREQFWLDQTDAVKTGYNLLNFSRSTQGREFTPEATERLRQAALKMWNDPLRRELIIKRIKETQSSEEVQAAKRARAQEQWVKGNIGR